MSGPEAFEVAYSDDYWRGADRATTCHRRVRCGPASPMALGLSVAEEDEWPSANQLAGGPFARCRSKIDAACN